MIHRDDIGSCAPTTLPLIRIFDMRRPTHRHREHHGRAGSRRRRGRRNPRARADGHQERRADSHRDRDPREPPGVVSRERARHGCGAREGCFGRDARPARSRRGPNRKHGARRRGKPRSPIPGQTSRTGRGPRAGHLARASAARRIAYLREKANVAFDGAALPQIGKPRPARVRRACIRQRDPCMPHGGSRGAGLPRGIQIVPTPDRARRLLCLRDGHIDVVVQAAQSLVHVCSRKRACRDRASEVFATFTRIATRSRDGGRCGRTPSWAHGRGDRGDDAGAAACAASNSSRGEDLIDADAKCARRDDFGGGSSLLTATEQDWTPNTRRDHRGARGRRGDAAIAPSRSTALAHGEHRDLERGDGAAFPRAGG